MRRFIEFVTLQTVVIASLAVLCTWLCLRFGLAADIPTSLLGIAVIFPSSLPSTRLSGGGSGAWGGWQT